MYCRQFACVSNINVPKFSRVCAKVCRNSDEARAILETDTKESAKKHMNDLQTLEESGVIPVTNSETLSTIDIDIRNTVPYIRPEDVVNRNPQQKIE